MTTTEQPKTDESPATPAETPETTAPVKDSILTKAPTGLHRRYTKYIAEKFGFLLDGAEVPEDFFEPGNKAWEDFVKVVQIAVVRYGEFQRSPENAEFKALEAQRKDQVRAAAEAEKQKAAAEKAAAKKKADEEAEAAKKAKTSTAEGGDEAKTRKPAGSKAKTGDKPEAPF